MYIYISMYIYMFGGFLLPGVPLKNKEPYTV